MEQIPLACIDGRAFRLRVIQDEQEQAELAASIAAIGLRHPLHVRPLMNGRFQVVDGERRLRALQDLQQADVPALVLERTDAAAGLDAILLNAGRCELSDYERAEAYRQLLDTGAVRSQQELACLVGCSQATVSNVLAMLDLPASARAFLERHPHALSSKSARSVAALYQDFPEHEAIIVEGLEQVRQGLKPRGLKAWVTQRISGPTRVKPGSTTPLPATKRCVVPDNGGENPAYVVEVSVEKREIRVKVENPDISLTLMTSILLQMLRSTLTKGAPDGVRTDDGGTVIREPVNDGTW